MRLPEEPVVLGQLSITKASECNSRFARTDIRPMSLAYPISHPCAKTLVVGIARNEESAAGVGGTASVECTQRDAILIYAEK